MKALDTNVLVRYLVVDDKGMALRALDIVKSAEAAGTPLLLTTLVLLEMLWVLRVRYGLTREHICDAIRKVENLAGVRFENPALIRKFLREAASTTVELADLLIALHANACGAETVLTFDRKAAHSPLFEAVP